MSEVLPESGCGRALGLLPQFSDGDLTAEQAAWLGGHCEACAECRSARGVFTNIDGELIGWGQHLELQHPPPPGAREQLSARLGPSTPRQLALRWMPAAAAAIAAALVLATIPPPQKPFVGFREPAAFVEIPYLPPLDPHENAAIVRINIRVATLIAMGYRITADPDEIVPADVLVGEDGRAHAVRVISNID